MLPGFEAKGKPGADLAASRGHIAGTEVQLTADVEDSQFALTGRGVASVVIPQLDGQLTGFRPKLLPQRHYIRRQVEGLRRQPGPPYPGRTGKPAIIAIVGDS